MDYKQFFQIGKGSGLRKQIDKEHKEEVKKIRRQVNQDVSEYANREQVSLAKKILFYLSVTVVIVFTIMALFVFIIRVLFSPIRQFLAPTFLPWIYIVAYALSVVVFLVIFYMVHKLIKDKPFWNKYFFDFKS